MKVIRSPNIEKEGGWEERMSGDISEEAEHDRSGSFENFGKSGPLAQIEVEGDVEERVEEDHCHEANDGYGGNEGNEGNEGSEHEKNEVEEMAEVEERIWVDGEEDHHEKDGTGDEKENHGNPADDEYNNYNEDANYNTGKYTAEWEQEYIMKRKKEKERQERQEEKEREKNKFEINIPALKPPKYQPSQQQKFQLSKRKQLAKAKQLQKAKQQQQDQPTELYQNPSHLTRAQQYQQAAVHASNPFFEQSHSVKPSVREDNKKGPQKAPNIALVQNQTRFGGAKNNPKNTKRANVNLKKKQNLLSSPLAFGPTVISMATKKEININPASNSPRKDSQKGIKTQSVITRHKKPKVHPHPAKPIPSNSPRKGSQKGIKRQPERQHAKPKTDSDNRTTGTLGRREDSRAHKGVNFDSSTTSESTKLNQGNGKNVGQSTKNTSTAAGPVITRHNEPKVHPHPTNPVRKKYAGYASKYQVQFFSPACILSFQLIFSSYFFFLFFLFFFFFLFFVRYWNTCLVQNYTKKYRGEMIIDRLRC